MGEVRNGSVTRAVRNGRVVDTGASAEGVHTMEEMRVFVAAHLKPIAKVGDPVQYRYELTDERSELREVVERPATPTTEGE